MHHSNKKSVLVGAVAAAMGLAYVSSASAQSPHVHGAASMNLVQEGKQFFVEFESPLASVVGFEYQPQSRVEKMKLKNAVKTLQSAELFEFSGADCELVEVQASTPWENEHGNADHDEEHKHDHDEEHEHDHDDDHEHDHDEEHEHDHDDDHEQDHDEDHEHDHDDDHEHDHDEEHEHDHDDHKQKHKDEHDHDHEEHGHQDKDSHSDLSVTYQFQCDGTVDALSLAYFSRFELMENIKVQWITEGGQGAATVTKASNRVSF